MPSPPVEDAPNELAALLAAILAEPDEPLHRLVYADALLARGDPQGELIQLSERALHDADPELLVRIEELERVHGEQIAGEVAELARSYTLRRGFVERVMMDADDFATHAEHLLARHPICELYIPSASDESLARLAEARALRSIRVLHMAKLGGLVPPLCFDRLCASPHLERLERLELARWRCTGDPPRAFAFLEAPRLRALELAAVGRSSEILAGFARNRMIRLRELFLLGLDEDRDRWPRLDLFTAFAALRTLTLSLDGDAGRRMLENVELPELESLEIGSFPLGLVRYPRLRKLAITDEGVTLEDLRLLLARTPHLRALHVDGLAPELLNPAIDLLMALPADHPLVAVFLGVDDADPKLVERLRVRFPLEFHAASVHD